MKLLLAVLLAASPLRSQDEDQTRFMPVAVKPGDTLWSIAIAIAPNTDTQTVIADIVSLNQLETATVQPGQRLAIPAEYSN